MSLQRRQIFRNSLHSVGSSDSLPGRKSLFCPSWCDAHSAVWALPWFLSRASPGVALLLLVWVWSSWTVPVSFGVPVLPALLISVASCRVSPEGFCARGSEAALPRLSWRIFLLCSTAGVGLFSAFQSWVVSWRQNLWWCCWAEGVQSSLASFYPAVLGQECLMHWQVWYSMSYQELKFLYPQLSLIFPNPEDLFIKKPTSVAALIQWTSWRRVNKTINFIIQYMDDTKLHVPRWTALYRCNFYLFLLF